MGERTQPRYLAYCRAHEGDPERQMAADAERWPGGVMTGFLLWIGGQWSRWREDTGHRGPAGDGEHAAFDRWLEERTCPICAEVGGPLVECVVCGLRKAPRGRSVGLGAANGYCGGARDCPGYSQEPHPGQLWTGERYGDSLGHMDWHLPKDDREEAGDG